MEWLSDPQLWVSFLTLTALEIVLGIDNLVFIAILSDRLPIGQRPSARRVGLALALITRLLLLSMLFVISQLTAPIVTLFGQGFSWRDLILLGGGLFLIYKATAEIHEMTAGPAEADNEASRKPASYLAVVSQIAVVDIIFSLDSVITAVGMADNLGVMVAAVVAAVLVMLLASTPLSHFVSTHPTVKMLALAFLLMVGLALIADGCGVHIPKGYLYAAMAFSTLVEALNLAVAKRRRSAT
jgi:predicted tellurium resistance membrane protein TerC